MGLIDVDGAVEHFRRVIEATTNNNAYNDGFVDALEFCISHLSTMPSAQSEIIHCENCKHWKNNHLCECLSRYGTFDTPKDFFCGYGKAK